MGGGGREDHHQMAPRAARSTSGTTNSHTHLVTSDSFLEENFAGDSGSEPLAS